VLCSVPDQAAAITEMCRVLRPGGELRLYQHFRSQRSGLARFQQALDVVWPYLGGGCHASRTTDMAIEATGFQVGHKRYLTFRRHIVDVPVSSVVIGVARKPA